jgi:PAS domain S-box-containing protein
MPASVANPPPSAQSPGLTAGKKRGPVRLGRGKRGAPSPAQRAPSRHLGTPKASWLRASRGSSPSADREEDRFRTIFERIPMALGQSDPHTGKLVRANARMCELTGYGMEELIGHSFVEWTHPDDRAANLEQYARMTRGEIPIYTTEKRYVRKDGSLRWVRVTAGLLPGSGESPCTLATIEDITDRRNAELEREELLGKERSAAERLRVLAEITRAFSAARLDLDRLLAAIVDELTRRIADACVVYLLSEDGQLLEPMACRHVDPAAEAILRNAISPSIPVGEGPSGLAAATGQTVVVGEVSEEELHRLTAPRFHEFNRRYQTRALLCVPLRVSERVIGTVVITRQRAIGRESGPFTSEDQLLVEEVSDRAALAIESAQMLVREQAARGAAECAQEDLRRAAEIRERLIGVVSHDLRNPLATIGTAAMFLARASDLPDRLARPVARISSAADRMHRIIEELLDFTRGRLGSGIPIERRVTNVGMIVRRVLDEFELIYPSRRLVLDISGRLEGEYDDSRLAQVVSNLVANALEYSPPDTPVRVVLVDRGEAGIALEVKNAGAPIRSDLLAHLFEPFRRGGNDRGNSGGLGLGLFIAAEVVRAHGGTISAASNAEDGTTLTVFLPHRGPARAS